MRLLTHNQLICVRRSCTNNYPLILKANRVEQEETEFNQQFILHIMPNIDYSVLYNTCKQLGLVDSLKLPSTITSNNNTVMISNNSNTATASATASATAAALSTTDSAITADSTSDNNINTNDTLLSHLHTVLMDTHIIEGILQCSSCNREYSIQQGIPNMRLNEDEV